MIRILCVALLLAAALPVLAAEQPAPAPPWLAADVQDVVFLGESRPILFRLHLLVDGKAYSASWNDYIKRLFDYLDRDGDGSLDRTEQARMPGPIYFGASYLTLFFQGQPHQPPPLAQVDADGDGKVSLEEFARFYQEKGAAQVQLTTIPGISQQSSALTNALFRLLDTDKDGKLSRAELGAAPNVLRKFDQDDDDLLTAAELQNTPVGNPFLRQQVADLPDGNRQSGAQSHFLLVPREPAGKLEQRRMIAQDILLRYDRNKDGKLSRDEVGFPKELFAWFKPDKAGTIGTDELLRYLLTLPDVELKLQVGKVEDGKVPVEVVETGRQQVPTLPVQKTSPVSVSLKLGRTSLSVGRLEGLPGQQGFQVVKPDLSQFLTQQFRQLDTEKKGFLTLKQLDGRQYQALRAILPLADRDGDEKLTEKELLAFHELMSGAPEIKTSLVVGDGGQGLFELLDSNRDGRLSVRELRQAWSRLREFDEDGDGKITPGELPRQCQLSAVKGDVANQGNLRGQVVRLRDAGVPPPARNTAGPVWFRKMDINGDGDVSAREFLGSPEDFARIDTDGDGLISLEEANQADQWFKDRLKTKP